MNGWQVWARSEVERARAAVCVWISEPLREARLSFRYDLSAERVADWRIAERVALAGGNATQPPIFGRGGALRAADAAKREAQVSPRVELTTAEMGAAEMKMHHGDGQNTVRGASTPAGGMRPRVTDDEIARVLTYVECGYSLRQAAAAVGRNHASVLRCIQRSPETAAAYRQKLQLAREQPLRQLHAASQHSWRAAAWLLTYLDQRELRSMTRQKGGQRAKRQCQT